MWIKSILLLSSLVIAFSGTETVYAAVVTDTNSYRTRNNIIFWDPNDNGITAECIIEGDSGNLPGNDNEEKAWNYFIAKGFTPQQTAGIIGNFQRESRMEPRMRQGGTLSNTPPAKGGYGIAQWDDRKDELAAYAKSQNRPVYDLSLQLDFTWYEMQNSEKAAYNHLKEQTTVRGATQSVMDRYERPGVKAFDERLAFANEAYNKYSGNPAPAPTTPGAPEPGDADCAPATGIVGIAQAELAKGVIESPIGCDSASGGSGSCGPEIDKYTDSHLEFWCADFVSWVYKTAGFPFTGGLSGGWRQPSSTAMREWFKQNGTFILNGPDATPQPGDVYFLNLDSDPNMDHVGIVEKVVGNDLVTISGNTSVDNFANGVGVGRHTYKDFRTQPKVFGFGRL